MSELITVKEAAEYLKLNRMTVYRLAQKRKIPALRVGGAWRFNKDMLDDWLAQQSVMDRGAVLVVDDDAMIRDLVEEVVSRQGYTVVTAGTGEEALEKMRDRQFALIFLDLVLPGVSGVEVFRAVKERDRDAVVAIITGHGDSPVAMEALSLGPIFLIRKPFEIADVIDILDIVMRWRR